MTSRAVCARPYPAPAPARAPAPGPALVTSGRDHGFAVQYLRTAHVAPTTIPRVIPGYLYATPRVVDGRSPGRPPCLRRCRVNGAETVDLPDGEPDAVDDVASTGCQTVRHEVYGTRAPVS